MILVITVICINVIWKKDTSKQSLPRDNNVKLAQTSSNLPEDSISIQENTLEKRLEEILKKMSGIDDVKVLITYSETNQIVPLYNEQEKETVTSDGQKTERDASKEVVLKKTGARKHLSCKPRNFPKWKALLLPQKELKILR